MSRRLTHWLAVTALASSLALVPSAAHAQQPASAADSAALRPSAALAEMQTALTAVMRRQPIDFTAYSALTESSRARVLELIASDAHRTPADFLVASTLETDPTGFYENRRLEHELPYSCVQGIALANGGGHYLCFLDARRPNVKKTVPCGCHRRR